MQLAWRAIFLSGSFAARPGHDAGSIAPDPVTAYVYAGGNKWNSLSLGEKGSTLGQPGQLHSQVGQDWIVQSLLNCPQNGYFVDLAANDAEIISNTLMVERDFNWTGLCLEPNPEYASKYVSRKCQLAQVAVGNPTDTLVTFNFKNVYSGIVGANFDNKEAIPSKSVQMYTMGLGDVLKHFKAPPTIDYLNLDVEGSESMVMQDFPYDAYKFKVLTVERPKPDLVQALTNAGYVKIREQGNFGDNTWINRELFGDQAVTTMLTEFKNGAMSSQQTCMTQKGYGAPSVPAAPQP